MAVIENMAHIEVKDLSLHYPIFSSGVQSIRGQLASIRKKGLFNRPEGDVTVIEALRGINMSLRDGDRVGLIGENGSGKTTLLKTLAGIYEPTMGKVYSEGKISTLISLGLGMSGDETGPENIRMAGLILGLSHKEIEKAIPEIEEFCDIGEFFSMPLRTYSTGMQMRLSFALATAVEPEILLIDEAIGAGDIFFAEKARQRIETMMSKLQILVMASHSEQILRSFCNKALLLRQGAQVMFGDVETVIEAYHASSPPS